MNQLNCTSEDVWMKNKLLLPVTIAITALVLAACGGGDKLKPGPKESARIMEQEQSQVAILLNKGFSSSVVAINNGKRIKPCKKDENSQEASSKKCYPEGHDPDGKVLFEETYKVTIREGSTCITVTSGFHSYDFCDPPYDLGF